MAIQRKTLVTIHLLVAAFLLPVAVMFFITGGLYTVGITGGYHTESIKLAVDEPLSPDLDVLLPLVKQELTARGAATPSGTPKIKKAGTSFRFEWTGSNLDVTLEPTPDPAIAKLKIKDTDWYRQFVQLHKAKGGELFKVYAVGLAIGLLVLLLSGYLMAWQIPRYRKQTVVATGLGVVTFVVFVFLS